MEVYLANPARNDSRSGLAIRSGGRSFQSLAVLGQKECIWAFILEKGIENLLRSEGVM